MDGGLSCLATPTIEVTVVTVAVVVVVAAVVIDMAGLI